jgi:hypothetical protein
MINMRKKRIIKIKKRWIRKRKMIKYPKLLIIKIIIIKARITMRIAIHNRMALAMFKYLIHLF